MLRQQALEKKAVQNPDRKEPDGIFAVQQADAQNAGTDYPLRDSVVLDNGTSMHIINDRSRFIDELRPSKEAVYAGATVTPIKGIGTAAITIQTPSGPCRSLFQAAGFEYIKPGNQSSLGCSFCSLKT